jgi:hypothetical protein
MQVLYLFAGAKRHSSLAGCLRSASKRTGLKINTKEVDILQGGRGHDLLRKATRRTLILAVQRGRFDMVVASPPCNTFSRARGSNSQGPPQVRSKVHPRGFPWLSGPRARQVEDSNTLLDFTTDILKAQLQRPSGLALLEHPEDLGHAGKAGTPGSIWQLDEVRSLAQAPDVVTGALRQSDWGTPYQKPTRLLGRLPGLDTILSEGWPTFDPEDRYTGPLAAEKHSGEPLIGIHGGQFRTSPTAAWPEAMCRHLAGLAVAAFIKPSGAWSLTNGAGEALTRSDGGGQGDIVNKDFVDLGTRDLVNKGILDNVDEGVLGNEAPIAHDMTHDPPPQAKRRRITRHELELLACGQGLGVNEVYVGRGGRGVPPSAWGNPFKVDKGLSRGQAVEKFKEHFNTTGLSSGVGELVGKDLLCHCGANEECHGDVLLDAAAQHAEGTETMATFVDDGLPVRFVKLVPRAPPQLVPVAEVGWRGGGHPGQHGTSAATSPSQTGGDYARPEDGHKTAGAFPEA